jgi:hypothetical protein
LLVESSSPHLPEVMRDMNKWSNNVIARHVLATLGAQAEPGGTRRSAGARVVERSLKASGISTDGLVIENGAGLSRSERVSAHSLGRTAAGGLAQPDDARTGVLSAHRRRDGTARRRVANSPGAGAAHIKTGTLDGVRSLAGYVLGASGRRYAVVLMINHPNAGAAREVQDALAGMGRPASESRSALVGVTLEGIEGNHLKGRHVGRREHHRRRHTGLPGLAPAQGAQAPAITGLESGKTILGPRRGQIIAAQGAELQKLGASP